jgi:hypothetical protein
MTRPFEYPATPWKRRHHPCGYKHYASFLPWLRDDFSFRCVFCLQRETWTPGGFHIDHLLPVDRYPELTTEYTNLLYTCSACNLRKGNSLIPDPLLTLNATSILVNTKGHMLATTEEASRIIEQLGLNDDAYIQFRSIWIKIANLFRENAILEPEAPPEFPAQLPDLSKLIPPQGNLKPEGVVNSHFLTRARKEAPEL